MFERQYHLLPPKGIVLLMEHYSLLAQTIFDYHSNILEIYFVIIAMSSLLEDNIFDQSVS